MSQGPTGSSHGLSRPGQRISRLGVVNVVVLVSTLLVNLLQQPGRVTFDTKLDLQLNPADFLARSLDLWNADWALGGLQNQASGYLFPMGPAFWLGAVLHVPPWVWERLWSALVMIVAYEGARRLARAWPGITPTGAVVAALSYMLAPRVLTTVGGLSGETLAGAVLPWTLLPVVLYLTGRCSARSAFALSAATIPWMGGQNATVAVACLVLPGLLLLLAPGRTWRRTLGDAAGWTGLAMTASLWWLVPLFLLGGYGPPFLDFVESSRNTASGVSWTSALRGTDHWVAYFPDGGSAGWVGGFQLASSATLLVTTLLVAGIGLAGLLARGLWSRRVLVASLVIGLSVLASGSGGWASSPFSDAWLDLLDGPLAPLRNIHKFDPLVRIPLSIGIGSFVGLVLPALTAGLRGLTRILVRRAGLGAASLVILAAAVPAATGSLRDAGGFEAIPASWTQAVAYLNERPGPVSALVLPAAGSGVQTWGRTVDEPIQVLGAPAWTARFQATVAPAATIRLQDSIEDHLVTGRPYDGLAETMARMGVTHVVVRNDLDRGTTDAPSPETVYASIAAAPALRSVASFGASRGGHPEVEVFTTGGSAEPRVSLTPREQVRTVQGGPEIVSDLTRAGLVDQGGATVLAGAQETRGAESAHFDLDVVTDSNRRTERQFGRLHDARSAVMSADEDYRIQRAANDYVGAGIPQQLTTAEYDGVVRIEASSSAGYADSIGPIRPAEHPYAAFDGSLFTSWGSRPTSDPRQQWLEIEFDRPRTLGEVGLLFDVTSGVRIGSVELSTDQGSVTVPVGASGAASDIRLPPGRTAVLRIAIKTSASFGQVRLANVAIDGTRVVRRLRLPGEVSADTSVYLRPDTPRRACLPGPDGASCDGDRQRLSVEAAGFDRTIDVAETGTWRLGGRVVAVDGPATQELLAPFFPAQVRVDASSVFAGDALVAGANAFDGRDGTSWYASPSDEDATLILRWGEKRTITSIRAALAAAHPGRLPSEIVVSDEAAGEDADPPQTVSTTGPDAGEMDPIRTTSLRLSFPRDPDFTEADAVGVTELRIGGLRDLRYQPFLQSATGARCGFGPEVVVGGQVVQTAVRGQLDDLLDGGSLQLVACDAPTELTPGDRRIRVTNTAAFAVSELWLTPTAAEPLPAAEGYDAAVASWSSADRTVEVDAPQEAVLALGESINAGWEATLDGHRLEPIAVDGWRQGWVVPAGAGTVHLVYAPQRTFTVATVVGLVLAGLLNLAAGLLLLLRWRRGSPRPPRISSAVHPLPRPVGVGLAVLLAVVSVPLAAGSLVGAATRRAPVALAAAAGAGALLFAAGVAVLGGESIIHVPALADGIVALVVGALAGRAFTDDA